MRILPQGLYAIQADWHDMKEVSLGKITLSDVREFLESGGNTIVIPVGSTEQHGPHLPYSVDVLIPMKIAERVATKINALVAPPINYGLSSGHRGFPGSSWLTAKTFLSVIQDVSSSFAESGFEWIVWLNGHYSNEAPLYVACKETNLAIGPSSNAKVISISYWLALQEEKLEKCFSFEAGWHANEAETALMLAIDPEVVEMENAKEEWPSFEKRNIYLNLVCEFMPWKAIVSSGVWGDPRTATPSKGQVLLSQIVESIVCALRDTQKFFESHGGPEISAP